MLRSPWARIAVIGTIIAGMAAFVGARTERTSNAEPLAQVVDLIESLRNGSDQVRREAAAGLRNLGPSATPAMTALLAALRDESAVVRAEAAAALGRLGPQVVGALIRALQDEHHFVRRGALAALALHGAQSAAIVDAAAKMLADSERGVRFHAAQALMQFGPRAESATLSVFRNGSLDAREAAAEALAGIRPLSNGALRVLNDALRDSNARIRQCARVALAASVPGSTSAPVPTVSTRFDAARPPFAYE
jgi:HEAT repeat protein